MKIRSRIMTALIAAVFTAGVGFGQTTIAWDGDFDNKYTNDTNWVGDIAPADNLTSNIAQLVGGTVDLDVDHSVNGLDISSASTLTGSGTRLILGSSGLNGAASLTLSNNVTLRTGTVTTYASDVMIDNGATVEVTTGDQGFLGTGTINLDNGGAIHGQGSHVNMRDTTSIVVGSGGGTFANAGSRAFYGLDNAVISGAGMLTLDGLGNDNYAGNSRIQISSGANTNTYTGGTLITNKANVQVNTDKNFGDVTGKVTIDDARLVTEQNIAFDASREFEFTSGGARISLNKKSSTINGALSGSGDLTIDGQSRDGDANAANNYGTLVLNGDNSGLTSDVLIDSAAVRYTDAGQLGSGVVTLDNGGEIYGANHIDMSGNTNIILGAGGGTIRHRHARNVNGLDNVVISGSGALTLAGESLSGSIRMSGNNTYTGGTIFGSGGYALVTSNDALGDSAGSITFDGGVLQNNNSNVELGNRAITINAGGGSLKSGWSNRRIVSEGVISGVGKLTILDDSSRVQLGGTNTYSGGTEIQGVVWASSGALGTGDVTLNAVTAGRGHLQNLDSNTVLTNNIILAANGGRLQAGWSKNLTIGGVVSGSGPLTIGNDSGTVILAADNTYSNGTTLAGCTLQLGDGGTTGSVGTSNIVFTSNSTLAFNRSDTVSVYDKLVRTGGSLAIQVDAGTVSLEGTNDNVSVYGVVKSGGVLVLDKESNSGVHAISGSSTVEAGGTLRLAGTGSDQIYKGGNLEVSGTLDMNERTEHLANLNLTPGSTVQFRNTSEPSTSTRQLDCGGTLTATNTTIEIIGTNLTASSTYPLIKFATGPADAGEFSLSLPAGVSGSLSVSGGFLNLTVTAVGPPTTTFADWVGGYGLTGSDADADYDYDGDMYDNLQEYAFGGDPTNSAVTGNVPVDDILVVGSTNWLTQAYAYRTTDTNLTVETRATGNLVSIPFSTNGIVLLGSGSLDDDFDTITNGIPMVNAADFLGVFVEQ